MFVESSCYRSLLVGDLTQQPKVVAVRPVLDDLSVRQTEGVVVGPHDGLAGGLNAAKERHCRRLVRSSHGQPGDDSITLRHEVLERPLPIWEALVEKAEDLLPPLDASPLPHVVLGVFREDLVHGGEADPALFEGDRSPSSPSVVAQALLPMRVPLPQP